jgi:hypothetical protein
MDIQSMDTGFPNINKVFAFDRSFRENHLLSNRNKEGNTALSAKPSMNRMISNIFILLIKPVAAANKPHKISDQKINLLALLLEA